MTSSKKSPATYYDSDGSPLESWGTKAAFRVFGKVAIDNNGPFFNTKSTARIGGYDAGSFESRVAQILHELAHLIYKPYPGMELIEDDDGNSSKSSGNTSKILDPGKGNGNCKTEINKIAQRIRDQRQ